MCFYLGTHQPQWLAVAGVPLFVSRRRLEHYRTLPRAIARWALDSGAFTELDKFGKWTITAEEYVALVRRFFAEVGMMDWASIQDWMCEPHILEKTGLTVAEHQDRTVRSLLELRALAPEIPWTPVLQGWSKDDYLDHVEQYAVAGVDLAREPIVGVGSVCRRQATDEVTGIIRAVSVSCGIRVHGFGIKTLGLRRSADLLVSSDSMAWSQAARRESALLECVDDPTTNHKNCANCMRYALRWRDRIVSVLPDRWRGGPDW